MFIVAADKFFGYKPGMRYDRSDALDRAIKAAGGVSKLAAAIGRKQPTVSSWKRVPAELVRAVERATGVLASDLRPDIFKPEETN
ncbi:MAG TPA: YdaS family helix-turn-helix protein [Stellaceae bacterium]|nr:YdaS family helix-turn-helix protein [Stellaceae bacterium]